MQNVHSPVCKRASWQAGVLMEFNGEVRNLGAFCGEMLGALPCLSRRPPLPPRAFSKDAEDVTPNLTAGLFTH